MEASLVPHNTLEGNELNIEKRSRSHEALGNIGFCLSSYDTTIIGTTTASATGMYIPAADSSSDDQPLFLCITLGCRHTFLGFGLSSPPSMFWPNCMIACFLAVEIVLVCLLLW